MAKRIAYLAGNQPIDNTMRLLSDGGSGTSALHAALGDLNEGQWPGASDRPLLLKLTRAQHVALSWLVKTLTMTLNFSYTQSGGHGVYSASYELDLCPRRSNYPPPRPDTADPDEDEMEDPGDDPPPGVIDRHVNTEEQLVGHATVPEVTNFIEYPSGVRFANPFSQARNAGIFLKDVQSTWPTTATNLNGGIGDDNGDFVKFVIFDNWNPFCEWDSVNELVLVPFQLTLSSGYGFGGMNVVAYEGGFPSFEGDIALDLGIGTIPVIKAFVFGGLSGKTFSCDITVAEWFNYTNSLGQAIWASGVRTAANPFA